MPKSNIEAYTILLGYPSLENFVKKKSKEAMQNSQILFEASTQELVHLYQQAFFLVFSYWQGWSLMLEQKGSTYFFMGE